MVGDKGLNQHGQHIGAREAHLPDFDPHSPVARGRGAYWVRAHYARAREEYAREGAWSCVQDEPLPPPPAPGREARAGAVGGLVPTAITRTDWTLRVNAYWVSFTLRTPHHTRTSPPIGPRIRRDMSRSISRLYEATRYLEALGVRPTHLITLTLPPSAWEELPNDDARLSVWRSALDRFQDAFRKRLSRGGYSGAYLWFLEFQARGAPHLHILVELGELSRDMWRDWADWLTRAWSSALGVPAPHATKVEALREPDFRYARAYALKPHQKVFPFPGTWGRTWGVGGPWRESLREARHEPRSIYRLSAEQAWLLLHAWVQSVLVSIPDALAHPHLSPWWGMVLRTMASMSSDPVEFEGWGYLGPQVLRVDLSQVRGVPRAKWWWGKDAANLLDHLLQAIGWAAPSRTFTGGHEDGVCTCGPPTLPSPYLHVPVGISGYPSVGLGGGP